MLVLSLIARPVLMVAGLFSAMLIMHYACEFLLYSFAPFAKGMHTHNISGIITIIAMVLLLVVLSLIVANKTYSLIYVIPDKALSWIGGGAPNLGESQMAGESKALVMATIAAGQTAGTQSVGKIMKDGEKQGQQEGEEQEEQSTGSARTNMDLQPGRGGKGTME